MTTHEPTQVEKATIKKLNAEAKKLEFDARKLDFEARSMEAELEAGLALLPLHEAAAKAELLAAEAAAVESTYSAEMARVNCAATLRAEEFTLAADHYHHHLHFMSGVESKSVDKALQQLAVWHRQDPYCDMDITMQSGGGSAMDGMHLFDQITAYSLRGGGTHRVTMTVRGYAASMAAILLQAADERVIGPESYLMIHEVSSGAQGKIGELKTEVKFLEHLCSRIVDLFVDRSHKKITRKQFETNWKSNDWWLDSAESLKLGFVDRIG